MSVLIVIDGERGIAEQDKKIAGFAHEAGRAAIFIVNKWDAVEKDEKTMHKFEQKIRDSFQFMHYAPILFVSAKTGKRIQKILPTVSEVAEQHAMRIPTSVLNQVIQDAMATTPPPSDRGRRFRVHYITQVAVKPPTIVFFVNDPEIAHFSYLRYLENQLRQAFPFHGTPLKIKLRKKSDNHKQERERRIYFQLGDILIDLLFAGVDQFQLFVYTLVKRRGYPGIWKRECRGNEHVACSWRRTCGSRLCPGCRQRSGGGGAGSLVVSRRPGMDGCMRDCGHCWP